jgi:hypothetical protein
MFSGEHARELKKIRETLERIELLLRRHFAEPPPEGTATSVEIVVGKGTQT